MARIREFSPIFFASIPQYPRSVERGSREGVAHKSFTYIPRLRMSVAVRPPVRISEPRKVLNQFLIFSQELECLRDEEDHIARGLQKLHGSAGMQWLVPLNHCWDRGRQLLQWLEKVPRFVSTSSRSNILERKTLRGLYQPFAN